MYPFLLERVSTFEGDAIRLENDHVELDAAMARISARFRLLAHQLSALSGRTPGAISSMRRQHSTRCWSITSIARRPWSCLRSNRCCPKPISTRCRRRNPSSPTIGTCAWPCPGCWPMPLQKRRPTCERPPPACSASFKTGLGAAVRPPHGAAVRVDPDVRPHDRSRCALRGHAVAGQKILTPGHHPHRFRPGWTSLSVRAADAWTPRSVGGRGCGGAGAVQPETQYGRLGRDRIAYQMIGEGPLVLVNAPGSFSHADVVFEDPAAVLYYRRLASFCKVVHFGRRGDGRLRRGAVGRPAAAGAVHREADSGLGCGRRGARRDPGDVRCRPHGDPFCGHHTPTHRRVDPGQHLRQASGRRRLSHRDPARGRRDAAGKQA